MYCIYKAENKTNGKIYIGKTNDFGRRKTEHFSHNTNHLFSRALNKYGIDNFGWEIIENFIETLEQSNERERHWIKYYNTYFRSENSNGYNMTRGGDGGSDWNLRKVAAYTPDGILLKSFDMVTDAANFYGISGTSSISFAADDMRLCDGKMFRYFDIEPSTKIEPYKRENTKKVKICKLSLDGKLLKTYSGICEAEKDGYRHTGILGSIKGRYKQSYGFQWCYEKDLQSSLHKKVDQVNGIAGTLILQFLELWEPIATFRSCADAARNIGAKTCKTIHKALNSNTHFAHGFKWLRSTDTQTW